MGSDTNPKNDLNLKAVFLNSCMRNRLKYNSCIEKKKSANILSNKY